MYSPNRIARSFTGSFSIGIALATLVAISPASFAQESAIEEVIVTATKRAQSVQDVPIAVSAFSGEDLDARGVVDVYGLQQISPSVGVYNSNSTSNGGTFRIRGIGTTGNNPGLESAVGTFIDGIYRSRSGIAFSDLVDLERIEVLRGPQGTLFGKNTSAGAINIISSRPDFQQTSGYGEVSIGDLESMRLKGALSAPIGDEFAFRVAGSYHKRNEGAYQDFESGEYYDTRDRWMLKGSLGWRPTETFEALLIVDYGEKSEDCCPAAFAIAGPTAAVMQSIQPDTFVTEDPSSRQVGINYSPFEKTKDGGFMLDLAWDVSDTVTIKSITGYRDFSVVRFQDWDFTNFDLADEPGQDIDESFENWSQEFQVIGSSGNFDWLVGGYFYTEELRTAESLLFGADADAYWNVLFGAAYTLGDIQQGEGYDAQWATDTEGFAIFTHNVWHMTDSLDLTLGLRYTEEEKKGTAIINGMTPLAENASGADLLAATTVANQALCNRNAVIRGGGLGAAFCDNASWKRSRKDDAVTGTLALGWAVNDDNNLYASYSRGFKAGGLNHDQQGLDVTPVLGDPNAAPADGIAWDPEKVDAFEVGHKGQFLDSRLTLNTAVFHTEIADFQLNTFTGTGFVVGNPGDATSTGVEVETTWLAHEYFTLLGGVTYADAKYDDAVPNLGGQNLTYAPKWSASVAGYLDIPIGSNWSVFSNLNLSWRDDHNTGSDLDVEKIQKAYSLLNGQLGLRTMDRSVEAFFWCSNCADEDYNVVVFDSVLQGGSFHTFLGAQRQWGVTLRSNF